MPSPKMVVIAPGDHRTISRTSPRLTRASARRNQVDTGISSQTVAIASSIDSQITCMATSQAAIIASPSHNKSGTMPHSRKLATTSMQENKRIDLPSSQSNTVSVASEDNPIVIAKSAPLFDQFHAFPKLPVEIRLAIWELTLPKSRRVTINLQKFRSRSDKKPVLLDVNQESRTLALKRYVEVDANRNDRHITRGLSLQWPVQFIDPKNDILVLHLDDLSGVSSYAKRNKLEAAGKELQKWMNSAPKIMEDVKKVVVIGEMHGYMNLGLSNPFDNKMKDVLAGFEPLEKVFFEVHEGRLSVFISYLQSTDPFTERFFGNWSKKPKVEYMVVPAKRQR